MVEKRELIWKESNNTIVIKSLLTPITKYFEMQDVEDLQIHNYEEVYLIKRNGDSETLKEPLFTKQYITTLVNTFISIRGYKITEKESVSYMLPLNYFRFTAMIGRSVKSGISLSIRLNDTLLYSPEDFGLTQEAYKYLIEEIIDKKRNVFFIGGTGTGKTSLANLFINYIPDNKNVFVIGDIHDYVFKQEQNCRELEAQTNDDWQEAINILLRSNPDQILIP